MGEGAGGPHSGRGKGGERGEERTRGAARSHSPASLPPSPLPPHTRRTLYTPPWLARRPPFPLPSGLPALGPPPPRARPPRPARISVSGRKGNAKPARPRGESGFLVDRIDEGQLKVPGQGHSPADQKIPVERHLTTMAQSVTGLRNKTIFWNSTAVLPSSDAANGILVSHQ
ncbi:basic proline-rich protein-like [Piliocolobus tephrosceles]|uniref:basic proline-rich protein-like n=1 Tax=Piliocolobus tephrosceles TaxID=591936 RepID=UPI00130151DA|nr:basic proline-rich protein-like [Piliocolobus tephrosceles]